MSGKDYSSNEVARAAELVEYDEITLTDTTKVSTQPAKTDNIRLTENSAYCASKSMCVRVLMSIHNFVYVPSCTPY